MNITDKDYFTFNVSNSMLLVGQTGSGKTELVRQYLRRLESAFSPKDMRYVIFDLKVCEFSTSLSNGSKEEYLFAPVRTGGQSDIDFLEELADLAVHRAEQIKPTPLLFIYIEECDLAAIDQTRFDNAVITINKRAGKANMKLIYSTSRPAPNVVSKKLIKSFDLILSGQLASESDARYLGVPYRKASEPYSFLVSQHNDLYDSDGKPFDLIDLSKIDLSFGGDNEPHDERLTELLKQAYKGEITCRRAVVPMELIVPFSDFVPQPDAKYTDQFREAYSAGTPPDLYVYENDGKFIMSDDYNAYFNYKIVNAKEAYCTVIGETTLSEGIVYGQPFALQLPYLEEKS